MEFPAPLANFARQYLVANFQYPCFVSRDAVRSRKDRFRYKCCVVFSNLCDRLDGKRDALATADA
jgi:hypothetical protein